MGDGFGFKMACASDLRAGNEYLAVFRTGKVKQVKTSEISLQLHRCRHKLDL